MRPVNPFINSGDCMKQNFFVSRRASLACAAFLAAAALASCNDDTTTTPSATPAAIAPASSPPATAQVATTVTGPAVTVTDAGGNPVSGVEVNFAVTGGGGALQYPVATTNEQGFASAGLWQIGPKVGVTNTSTAAVTGLPLVTFSVLANVAGPPTAMAAFSGDAQSGASGSTTSAPLQVRLTDAAGNPKPGVAVTFTATAGGGSISSAPATTDASGIATSGLWTFGSCRAQVVQAQTGTLITRFSGKVTGQPAITVGGTAAGALAPGDCVVNGAFADEYLLTTANEAVNITLTAPTFDALLNISNDAALIPIASNDNESGTSTNSFVKLIAGATTKTVTATSAAAAQTGAYTLSVASTSAAVTACGTTYIEISASTAQTLTATDCGDPNNYDEYKVYLAAGAAVRIDLTHGTNLDGYLMLISPGGTTLSCADDNQPGGQERVSFTASTAGFYTIRASAWGLKPPGACDTSGFRYGAEFAAYTLTLITP
jgi:pre-peptidase/Big-like domain-containing protein